MSKLTTFPEARMEHANAPLTASGRLRVVLLVEEQGMTFAQSAACANVSKSTVWEWVWRWRRATVKERATLACLRGRSSRPLRSPGMLAAELQKPGSVKRAPALEIGAMALPVPG